MNQNKGFGSGVAELQEQDTENQLSELNDADLRQHYNWYSEQNWVENEEMAVAEMRDRNMYIPGEEE